MVNKSLNRATITTDGVMRFDDLLSHSFQFPLTLSTFPNRCFPGEVIKATGRHVLTIDCVIASLIAHFPRDLISIVTGSYWPRVYKSDKDGCICVV